MSQVVIFNIGVSGAGKTTWSVNKIKKEPNFVRINRDAIRKHYYGEDLSDYYGRKDLDSLEGLVSGAEVGLFFKAIKTGYSVIIDNTNLKKSYIDKWLEFIEYHNEGLNSSDKIGVKFKLFPTEDAEFLKKRVNVRDSPLGWDKLNYIDKQVASIRTMVEYVERNYKDQIINE